MTRTSIGDRTLHKTRTFGQDRCTWRTLILSASLLTFGLGVSATARADQVDQQNIAPPTTNLAAVYSGQSFGQTITVGLAGTLTEVAMYVDRRGNPTAALNLEVRAVVDGLPGSSVLTSASLAAGAVVSGLNTFDVGAALLDVQVGQQLAILLRSGAALGNDYLAREVPGDMYPGGTAVSDPQNNGNWAIFGTGFDAIFQTRVSVSTTTVLPFGAVTAAIENDTFEGLDTYDVTLTNSNDLEADSNVFNTIAGSATSRSSLLLGMSLPDGSSGSPGVDVGAQASGAGQGRTSSRSVAFRTFQYTGQASLTVTFQTSLDGTFLPAPFGLPTGDLRLFAEVSVIRGDVFMQSLPANAQALSDMFFAVPNAHTTFVDPADLVARNGVPFSVSASYGPAVIGHSALSLDPTAGTVSQPLVVTFTLSPGQLFTVMVDMAAFAGVQCTPVQCGSGEVSFYNSLKSSSPPFVDSSGNAVTEIQTTEAAPPPSVPAMPPDKVILLAAALASCGFIASNRKRRTRASL
jgi:hypothetical protein